MKSFEEGQQDELGDAASKPAINVRLTEQELTSEIQTATASLPIEPPDSGDFHESFTVPDGSRDVVCLVGDVTGHGAPAAIKADIIRRTAVASLKSGDSPLDTIAAANAVSQTPEDRYATLFVAKIDGVNGHLHYANAGHEPPIIVDKQGNLTTLPSTGPPLGVVPEGIDAFEEKEAELTKGGTLLVTTDGISEARIPNRAVLQFFGHERVINLLQRLRLASPVRIVSTLLNAVIQFTKGFISDDVAVMAVRRKLKSQVNRPKDEEAGSPQLR